MSERKPLVQWTITEFISVFTVGTLILGAMWAPEPVFKFTLFVTMVLVLAIGTIALTGRGESRLFATGFTMVILAYTAMWMLGYATQLPTHDFWLYLQPSVTRAEYVEDPPPSLVKPVVYQSGIIYDARGRRISSIKTHRYDRFARRQIEITPTDWIYTATGHVAWPILLAYCAGKFAVGFRRYQNRKTAPASAVDLEP